MFALALFFLSTLGLTLKVSDPVFYANTTPPPIVVSNPSYVHPNFFLQLSVQCSRESYVWAVCSSHRDMSIPQIQEAGQKFCVLGDVPFQMTLSLAEAISSDVHVHLVARDLAGNLVATHASIPFTLQTTRPLTSESIDLPASPLLFEKPTDTPSLLSAPVSSRLLASVSSVTSTLPETALNTVCSKSELLSLLSQAALLPSAEFPVTSIIGRCVWKLPRSGGHREGDGGAAGGGSVAALVSAAGDAECGGQRHGDGNHRGAAEKPASGLLSAAAPPRHARQPDRLLGGVVAGGAAGGGLEVRTEDAGREAQSAEGGDGDHCGVDRIPREHDAGDLPLRGQ